MSARMSCPECSAEYNVADRMRGRLLRCPECDQRVSVPVDAPSADGEPEEIVDAEPLDVDVLDAEPVEDELLDAVRIDVEPHRGQSLGEDMFHLETAETSPALAHALPPSDEDDLPEPAPLSRRQRQDQELDMTPMVDVTFLLLIFFMVTASFSLQKSIPMPRSQSEQPSTNTVEPEEDDFESVTVQVDEFNGFLVLASDWEREVPGKQNLTTALKEAFNPAAAGMRLDVVCHEKAKLQSLVDAMDAGAIANYTEIQITEVEFLD